MEFIRMNFIIPIYSYITSPCRCIDSLTTTYRSDITCYGNYGIHYLCLIKNKFGYIVGEHKELYGREHLGGVSMGKNPVVTYVSNNSSQCEELVKQLGEWEIDYELKNVSEEHGYLQELQKMNIFGTPTTIVKNTNQVILGFPKGELRRALGAIQYKE